MQKPPKGPRPKLLTATQLASKLSDFSLGIRDEEMTRHIAKGGRIQMTNYSISWVNKSGHFHREDGPATQSRWSNIWYINGEVIRRENATTTTLFEKGKRHCIDGPAVVAYNGKREYWVNGQLHREDGPAIIGANGSEKYYQNNVLHRVDGPAVIDKHGNGKYYLHGKKVASGIVVPVRDAREVIAVRFVA